MSRHFARTAQHARRHARRKNLRIEALEDRRLMAIAVAENLLVDLDARHPSAASGVWDNTGSLAGDFQRNGTPLLQNLGPNASPAVVLNQTPNGDYYQGPVSPDGIEGSGTRSIEVWAFNPSLERAEETLVAWGHRGSTNQNMSFNYSANAAFGAVGHWANDLGWTGAPAAGQWHHLVFTHDGTTSRVYADGVLRTSRAVSLDTFNDYAILLGTQHTNSAAPGTPEISGLMGTLGIGNVRIHDGVLNQGQIVNNFNEDAARYGVPLAAPLPLHRYSFNDNASDLMGNAAAATLFNGAQVVGGELVLTNTLTSGDANGQYATLPIGSTIGRSNELTVEGWFSLSAAANWQRVFDFGHNTDRYMLFTPTSGEGGNPAIAAIKGSANNERRAAATFTIPPNVPTHFAVVADTAGNATHLYINGQLAGTTPDLAGFSPLGLGTTPLNYLGRSFFAGDAYLRGRIDEIRIYDDALSGGQVASSFAAGPNALNAPPTPANDTYTVAENASLNASDFSAPTTSYTVPGGTIGNQNYGGPLGLEFNVNAPITITHLGVFDSGADGLTTTITASIYDRNNTTTPLATLTFTPADPGVLEGGSRMKLLSTPITLPAGFQGTMVAKGFNTGNENGNSATPPWSTNSNGGMISFVGLARYGLVTDNYPGFPDGGPPNRYAAGTFKFNAPGALAGLLANDADPNALQAPRIVPSFDTPVISADFNNNQAPSNVTINRTVAGAGLVQNGRLELTQAVNSQQSTAIISKPVPQQLLRGFDATFDLLLGNGSAQPADGVAFVYGNVPDNASFGENFNGAGLQVQFQTYNGGGQPTSFKLVYNNVVLKRVDVPVATLVPGTSRPVQIQVTPDGLVTLRHNNTTIYEVQVPGWSPQANWRFAMGARTGGLNQQAFVDNLNITGLTNTTTSAQGVSVTVNADGTFNYDPSTVAAFNALSQGQIAPDTFSYSVSDGASISTATVTVNVVGVNDPVANANAGGPYTIAEGADLTLVGSATDVDANDTLTYRWDLDNDGAFDDAVGGATIVVPWSVLAVMTNPIEDQANNLPIRLQVSDGLTTTTANGSLTVTNAPPTLELSALAVQAVPGQPIDLLLSATDPAAEDQDGDFTYQIDWDGNGSFEETDTGPSEHSLSHAYSSAGTYLVRARAIDNDGGQSAVATISINIAAAVEENGVLIVGGGGAADRIIIQSGGSGGLTVRINNKLVGTFGNVSEGMIFGGGGADTITIASSLNIPFTIDGGDGNDYITGGSYDDTLIGGAGSDRLLGGRGNDNILGGDGNDTISGGHDNDVLDGEDGKDTVNGELGDDTVLGGAGNDRVTGGNGSDLVRGGDDIDIVDGGEGDDVLSGDADSDKLYGRNGDDVLIGSGAFDYLYGGAGEDLVNGNEVGDDSDLGLLALLGEWIGGGSFDERIETMSATIGAFEDGVGDSLNGERDADWYLLFFNDAVPRSERANPNFLG